MALLFHGALRRSEVAARRWADVELADGGDVIVTVRRSKTNQAGDHPDVRRLVGGCAAAVRRLQAATAPEPGDSVVGLGVDLVNRRFTAACAAAGLEGRRTSHGGRVGLAVELTARGAATHAMSSSPAAGRTPAWWSATPLRSPPAPARRQPLHAMNKIRRGGAAVTTWGADHDWNVRWVLVSGFWVQLASERFKCAYVAPNNDSGAFEAVVIPAPPVADLESLVATLDAVPGIALTVVRALGYIHLGAGAKGSNPRHARRRGAGHLHRRAARRRTRLLEHPAQRRSQLELLSGN